MRTNDSRHRHLDLSLFLLSHFDCIFPLLQKQISVILSRELLKVQIKLFAITACSEDLRCHVVDGCFSPPPPFRELSDKSTVEMSTHPDLHQEVSKVFFKRRYVLVETEQSFNEHFQLGTTTEETEI